MIVINELGKKKHASVTKLPSRRRTADDGRTTTAVRDANTQVPTDDVREFIAVRRMGEQPNCINAFRRKGISNNWHRPLNGDFYVNGVS